MSDKSIHHSNMRNNLPLGKNNPAVGLSIDIEKHGGNYAPGEPKGTWHGYSSGHSLQDIGSYKWWRCSDPDDFGYSHHTFEITSAVWTANDDLKLINKLKENAFSGDFNAGNMLGELPQTVSMLGGLLHDLRRGLMKGVNDVPSAWKRKRHQDIGDRNLEFQFGIRPLLTDIYEASQVIGNLNTRVKIVKAGRKAVPGSVKGTGDCEASGRVEFGKRIIAELSAEPAWYDKVGLSNPAAVLWELTPWSFVVDWVLPIGDWIDAQSFVSRTKAKYLTTTFSQTYIDAHLKSGGGSSTNPLYCTADLQSTRIRNTSVQRTVSNTLNIPLPGIKSSLLGGKPLERLANALSLLNGLAK